MTATPSRNAAFAIALALLSACAQQGPASPAAPPVSLSLATGAAGGTFVEYGNNLAKLLSADGRTISARNTGGSLDNLRCLSAAKCDIGLVAMAPAFEAWNGLQWTKDRPLRGYSAMMPMYETPFHLATVRASDVTRLPQLAGRKVGVGPKGGANELIFRAVASSLQPPVEMVYGTPAQMADGVIKGTITAFFFGAGAPVPAYRQIAERAQIVFLPIDGAALASAKKEFPYLTTTVLPANSYSGQTQAVPTLGLWNFVLVRDGVPADAVYAMTRAILSRGDLPAAIHPTAAQTSAKNLDANSFLPIHPGAMRYYREVGIVR